MNFCGKYLIFKRLIILLMLFNEFLSHTFYAIIIFNHINVDYTYICYQLLTLILNYKKINEKFFFLYLWKKCKNFKQIVIKLPLFFHLFSQYVLWWQEFLNSGLQIRHMKWDPNFRKLNYWWLLLSEREQRQFRFWCDWTDCRKRCLLRIYTGQDGSCSF